MLTPPTYAAPTFLTMAGAGAGAHALWSSSRSRCACVCLCLFLCAWHCSHQLGQACMHCSSQLHCLPAKCAGSAAARAVPFRTLQAGAAEVPEDRIAMTCRQAGIERRCVQLAGRGRRRCWCWQAFPKAQPATHA